MATAQGSEVTKTWSERDLQRVWHPCTQMHDHETLPMVSIARGEASYLIGHDGRRYLDMIGSWWTCLFGHSHPPLVAALKAQLDQLDHVLLAGFTHEPAVELAEALIACAPAGLSRVFYADNGSSATDAALKMALHYWRNLGRERKQRFICLSNSYHGETVGALAVSDVALYREHYGPLLFSPLIVTTPDRYEQPPDLDTEAWVARCVAELAQTLEQHGQDVAAMIVEPLVQCAGGMRMYPESYLRHARRLCSEHEVLLIVDEIAVGMARTGKMWGSSHAQISPDLLLTSKALTGGFLPLAAVLAGEHIYQAFYAEYQTRRAFLHSHSYSGNPIACRAAVTTLNLLKAPEFADAHAARCARMQRSVASFADLPHVADTRSQGFIGAIELAADVSTKRPFAWQERRGLRVYRHGLEHGVLLRPLGNVVYFFPPYGLSEEEFQHAEHVARAGILLAVAD